MKKLFAILLLMIAVCANAQHMKFMNIPLDGTIDNFQAKLAQKGITPDRAYNAQSPAGSRLFNGIFCGHKADIYAYYNTKTKVVYRSKACIGDKSKEYIDQLYNEIKEMLQEKYNEDFNEETGTFRSHESYCMSVYNEPKSITDYIYLGTINLYVSYNPEYYVAPYTLHIDYEDTANSVKNDNKNSDDL